MAPISFLSRIAVCSLALLPLSALAKDAVSLTSSVLASYKPTPSEGAKGRAQSAKAFMDALNAERKAEAQLPLDSPERAKWTNVPPRGPQGGVRLGDLDEAQLKKACDFLATALSADGYQQAIAIPLADDLLLRDGKPRPGFGAENYWLAIFGDPDAKKPWAIQFDGHHVAINVTYAGESACYSPSFIGTQPAKISIAGEENVVMGDEVDKAFKLIASLSDEQRSKAVRGGSRGRIQTAAGRDGQVPEQVGVSCKTFSEEQRASLLSLLEEWVGDLPKSAAVARLKQLEGEVEKMSFAWHGPTAPGSDVSYRIQGPTLIVEYACQDLGGDPLNHLHSMYRDPTNEYGKKLIGAK